MIDWNQVIGHVWDGVVDGQIKYVVMPGASSDIYHVGAAISEDQAFLKFRKIGEASSVEGAQRIATDHLNGVAQ